MTPQMLGVLYPKGLGWIVESSASEGADIMQNSKCTVEVKVTHTRMSIPTRLAVAGVEYSTATVNGLLVFVIDGEQMTPGQAAARYLTS